MTTQSFPPFKPHSLLRNRHAQTLFGFYARAPATRYQAQPHEVRLPDNDTIMVHDDQPANWKRGDRVVLMIPGLGGCHASPFMPRIAAKLNAVGFRTFRMDLRGCGPGYHLARGAGHAGRSEDSLAAVHKIAQLCPGSLLTAVGCSMGGNIVLKMLGELGDLAYGQLDSAISVAPPIDLLSCSLNMQRAANRIYSRSFVRALLNEVKRRRPFNEELQRLSTQPRPQSLLEFDDRFTAPLSGFADAQDYYKKCSCGPLLPSITVPTLVITAADDPLIPVSIFDEFRLSASTSLLVTENGGHMGYIAAGGVDPDRRWLDWRIVDWIQGHDERQLLGDRHLAAAADQASRQVPSRLPQ